MDIKCRKTLKRLYESKLESLKHLCHVYGKNHIFSKEMKSSKDVIEKILNDDSDDT